MSFINATVERFVDPDKLPKTVQEWAVPAAAAVVLIACTSYLLSGKGKENKPPVVPSWIPWVGSQWEMERDPDAFFDAAAKKYGPIFTVHHHGSTYTYVTTSALVNQIQRQPKVFNISVPQKSWMEDIWIATPAVLQAMIHGDLHAVFHYAFLPANIHPFVEAFAAELRDAVKTINLPTESVPLHEWQLRLTYRTTGKAYFGPTFDTEGTFEDYLGLDEMVWKVALGYPNYLLRHFVACRERLVQYFMKYAEETTNPPEDIGKRIHACQDNKLTEKDVGAMLMASWWPLMANVPLGSLWTMILQLQRPEGLKNLRAELDAAGAAWSAAHPDAKGPYTDHLAEFFQSNPHVPLLVSTVSEVLRFTSDSYSMRGVLVDETELGGYTLKKDETVICRTRAIHYNDEEFPNAKEFIPTRFMADDGSSKGTEGSFKWMPFGGGISMCSGRHFAAYHQRILLATLITQFNFEVDRAKSEPVIQSGVNRGFGLRRPSGDLYVKITRA